VSAFAAKRFWTDVSVRAVPGGFEVLLDARVLKTPGKVSLLLPTEQLAKAVAAEWAGVEGLVKPHLMPMTRLANTAIEKVAPLRAEVIEEILRYGGSDLLCYRAEAPSALIARENEVWSPLLDWAAKALGARLTVTSGIIAVDQPSEAMDALRKVVTAHDHFALTALYDMTAISGSLIIALAAANDHDPESLWRAARLQEHVQSEQWGVDEEAAALELLKKSDFLNALRFLKAA
jgi:chaperone required for assembly of F1-ATPase